jgi:hypothetical protein
LLRNKSKMSAIDRFNKYKSLADAAASACIRMFLHIVRPTEGFPYHSNFAIQQTWAEWKDADEVFCRMTGLGAAANHVFPTPPPEDAEHVPCRQMWGLLVQEQVESQDFQAPLIKNAVAAILASEACKSHPATCACKVPKNPWTWHECVAALEPLGLKHNPKCHCGGYQVCKQTNLSASDIAWNAFAARGGSSQSTLGPSPYFKANEKGFVLIPASSAERKNYDESQMSLAEKQQWDAMADIEAVRAKMAITSPPVSRQSAFDYKHHVDDCACGTCHKARVDSGTQDAYEKRCKEASRLVLERMAHTTVSGGSASKAALDKAAEAISVASTKAGGADKADFAKNLFAAMGTPHDSKCTHSLPFYSCMSCSH